jgi:hypothetical protein
MYNYGRTLLLNVTGDDLYFANVPGDELISSEYVQQDLPSYLRNFRKALFGAAPDRAMLDYRAAQLLQLVEATELQQHILALDPRLTYSSYQLQLAAPVTFSPAVTQYGEIDPLKILTVIGGAGSPDSSGGSGYDYRVTLDGVNITIDRLTPPPTTTQHVLSFTSGLSASYDLPGSGYKIRVNTSTLSGGWSIKGFLRPTLALDTIEAEIQNLGESQFLQLFGVTDAEPYVTFKNCWNNHPEFAYRLGGLVLAYIYRTKELAGG